MGTRMSGRLPVTYTLRDASADAAGLGRFSIMIAIGLLLSLSPALSGSGSTVGGVARPLSPDEPSARTARQCITHPSPQARDSRAKSRRRSAAPDAARP